jgi:hypothetical protein
LLDLLAELRLLTGPRGSGKSALLTYAAQYGRLNGWIVVFVPDAFAIMQMGKVLVPSKLRAGMVDQHDVALKLLKETAAVHAAQLARVPQRGRYAKHRYLPAALDAVVSAEREQLRLSEEQDKARLKAQADAAGRAWDAGAYKSRFEDESDTGVDRAGFTLLDLAQWGQRHPSAATDCLLDLLAELRLQTEFPVMCVVDSLNLLYGASPYPEAGSGALLPAERLSVPAALQCLGPEGFRASAAFRRGLWLAAVSFTHSQDMAPLFESASVRGRVRLAVPPLSRQEVFSVLSHYAQSGGFLMLEGVQRVDPFLVEYYRTLSGGNYREIFRSAIFTPQPPLVGRRSKNFRARNA